MAIGRRLQRAVVDRASTPENTAYGALPIGEASYPVPSSNTLWVSTSGNDANPGTQVAPKQTIKAAAAAAATGATIIVRGGIYYEGGVNEALGSGITFANNDVTVQNYPGEAVWLDGSQVVTGWSSYDTNKYRAAVSISLDRAPTQVRGEQVSDWGSFLLAEHPIAHWPEEVFLDGVPLEQVQNLSDVGPGKFFVQGAHPNATGTWRNLFTSTHYVLGDNPAGKEVRIATLARALSSSRTGLTLRGIGFRRYATSMPDWGCVYVSGEFLTIENCHFTDHSDYAVHVATTERTEPVGPRLTVRHNTFLRCGRKGLGANYAHDGIIEWNYFEQTNCRGFNYGPDGGAIKLVYSDRTHVRYNRFHDNHGHGIWYDGWCKDTLTYGNHLTDTWGGGIFVEISATCLVVDNIIINNGIYSDASARSPHSCPGITIAESDDCDVWYNTIIGAERGIHIAEGARSAGLRGVFPTVTSGRICNNVIADMAGLSSVQSSFLSFYDENNVNSTTDFGITFRSNLYSRYDSSHPARMVLGREGSTTSVYWSTTGAPSPSNLPPWATATGDTSRFATDADLVIDKPSGRLTPASLTPINPYTTPSEVSGLMQNSPFVTQRVGAGYAS